MRYGGEIPTNTATAEETREASVLDAEPKGEPDPSE